MHAGIGIGDHAGWHTRLYIGIGIVDYRRLGRPKTISHRRLGRFRRLYR